MSPGTHGVAVTNDGKYAYITDLQTNNLIIFNIKTYEVIKEIEIGNAPHEIDFAKM